jgi:hypothetical protein
MDNPNIFEEARKASAETLGESMQTDAVDAADAADATSPENGESIDNTIPEPENGVQQVQLDEAATVAETAAQTAADNAALLQETQQRLEASEQRNAQLTGIIDELSKKNEQQIIEEVMEPPVLDVSGLAFADEETVSAAQSKYAADMAEYMEKRLMKELSPALEYAKQGMHEKEKNEAIANLSGIPALKGIGDMVPQLDRLIANNKWLQSEDMPMEDRYINAYAIARGVDSINAPAPQPPKAPTVDELMAMYNSNPEFQEMIEQQRIEKIKHNQQVPPLSASSGNAALNIKETPKSFDEVYDSLTGRN